MSKTIEEFFPEFDKQTDETNDLLNTARTDIDTDSLPSERSYPPVLCDVLAVTVHDTPVISARGISTFPHVKYFIS